MSSKEARAAAKAEREAAREARKTDREAIKTQAKSLRVSGDASAEDILEILISPTAEQLQKQSALAKIVKDPKLYTENLEMFHDNLDKLFTHGGRINYFIAEILNKNATLLIPYIDNILEMMSDPKVGSVHLPQVRQLAGKFPAELYPRLDRVVGICADMRGGSSIPIMLIDIMDSMNSLTSPEGVPDVLFSNIIKVMRENNTEKAVLSKGLEAISNMKELVSRNVLTEEMPFLDTAKDANMVVYSSLVDFIAGRSLANVTSRLDQHEQWLKDQEARLDTLAQKFDISQEKMTEMTENISKLMENDEQTSKMLSMLDEMAVFMDEKITADRLDKELEQLLDADPYKRAFYNSFRSELTATYLAAKSVQTDIVTNSKTGVAGSVGEALQTASSFIPMIGAGVAFFGAVMSAVDSNLQTKMVKRYADIAADTDEMNQLSRTVGAAIVRNLDREKLDRPESLMDKCKGLLQFGADLINGNIGEGDSLGTVASETTANYVQSTVVDNLASLDFKRFFSKKKKVPLNEEQLKAKQDAKDLAETKMQGADDAATVANTIISLIYSGKVKQESLKDKIMFLQSFALTEFGAEASLSGVILTEKTDYSAVPSAAAPVTTPTPTQALAQAQKPSPPVTVAPAASQEPQQGGCCIIS